MVTDGLTELDRGFALLATTDEPYSERDLGWFQHLGATFKWINLLNQRRVVLLAEQSSGKTSEFKLRQRQLQNDKKFAFRVRIEDLIRQQSFRYRTSSS
jgi:hypothetical protein